MGDALGLLSAFGYGIYTILMRMLCPHDETRYSMQLVLGHIGLVNGVLFGPVVLYQLMFSNHNETASELTWTVFAFLIGKGMFDNALSDYLWVRAVILTSATVATVGTGLTIPLAFLK